ncbi:unnamed protein product, partial [Prorocentrum cordatum]
EDGEEHESCEDAAWAFEMPAGLRPTYARRLGWRRGPSGEPSCFSSAPLPPRRPAARASRASSLPWRLHPREEEGAAKKALAGRLSPCAGPPARPWPLARRGARRRQTQRGGVGGGRRRRERAGEEKRRRWDGGSGAAVRPHGPEQRPEAPLPVQRERQAAKALERTQARCGDLSLPPSLSPPIGSLAVLPPTRPVVAEHGWAGVKNGPWGLTCCPCQSRRSGSRCPCRGARPGGRSRRSAHWTRRSASASALSQSSPPPGHGTWPCCPHSCRRGCAITTSPAPQRPAPLRTDPTRRGSD